MAVAPVASSLQLLIVYFIIMFVVLSVFQVVKFVIIIIIIIITAWYLVARLLQRFLNEAQDETRAGITRQAVRKKEIYTYFLKIMC